MDLPGDAPPANSSAPAPPHKRVAATETYVELMERLAPGTRVAGRYVIQSIAGVGGMGVVYRARDEELGVDVALKVLRPDLGSNPGALERFRSELVSARQVTHRNAVRLHDIGEHAGMRFLTMDYVEGRSLREILERDGPLPADRAGAIVRQIAEALEAAHSRGIVHRDLKPGNVLIDAAGTAFLTDFGVARSLERTGGTRAGAIVGTPDYLAPEQVSGDPVDGRTDLYALGIVFFEMLSGQLPFSGESQSEILAQRLAGRPRDLKESGVAAPPWIRNIIRRCLERSPARRYPDARALIEDLDRAGSRRGIGWKAGALAAALLLAAAAGLWTLAARRTPGVSRPGGGAPAPVAAQSAVAVLPLSDQTGQTALAWTGPGIAEMLTANLSESPNLRVLDSLRVTRGAKDLRLAAGPVEEATARQLAELWSVDTLVTGTVRRAGPRVRVDLSVLKIGSSGVVTASALAAEGKGEEDIFRVVGSLGAELRRRLGVSAPSATEIRAPETRSLEAAKAYEEGKIRLARGDDLNAAPAFERAVAADPRFTAALEKLAETYQGLGYQQKAVRAAESAVAALDREETRQAYRARARLALLRGNPADAEKSYRKLVSKYPNDTEPRLDLAAAQAAQGHNAEAVETLKSLVALDANDARAWFLLGKNTILIGDSSRAIKDYLVRALALQTQLGNEKGKADVLNAIGVAYQQVGDVGKALENYTLASDARRKLGDERGLASTLRNRALVENSSGRTREAEADLRAAREIFEKIGDANGLSDVLNDFGVLYEGRGEYAGALSSYQAALKIRRGLGDERLLAQSHDNVGYIYYLQGQYDNALVYWQQALEVRRKIGEKNGVVLSMQNLGFLAVAQGRWDEATKIFAEALEKSRETDLKEAMIISLGNLGVLQHYRGRYGAALASLGEALALAGQLNSRPNQTEFTIKQAAVLLDLGALAGVGEKLDAAEAWVRETGNSEQGADLEVLRAEWNVARGDHEKARAALRRAVSLAQKSGSRATLLQARIAAASQGAPDTAALASALADADSLGHTLLTIRAAEALARAELSRRRFKEAGRLVRRAVELAEHADWSAGLYRLYALEGRALGAAGEGQASAESFAKSAREIAKLRDNVPPDMHASFDALPEVRYALARAGGSGKTREDRKAAGKAGG